MNAPPAARPPNAAALATQAATAGSTWGRARRRLAHSIKLRLVLLFMLLAAAMTFVFVTGAQKAFSVGWREAARPLLMDYVDRLAAEVAGPPGQPPSPGRARAITERLPLTVRIEGPLVQWESHPGQSLRDRARDGWRGSGWKDNDWGSEQDGHRILRRSTADGHSIEFGINEAVFERRPRLIGFALTALLLLTLLAWLYARRLLKPLDAIGEGARRFGAGDFSQPIAQRHPSRPDELDALAGTINTMGQNIHQMLEAKRALLLAISHELRSPLTRARLNTELLPDSDEVQPQRQALLRDLQEMASLISDLLESERLAARHAALQREPVDVVALAASVLQELAARHPGAQQVRVDTAPGLPAVRLDPSRVRLLLRNLLDNALRHGAGAAQPPELALRMDGANLSICVRDHGPGVPEEQIGRLAEAFYRPDSARTRSAGGVGLGLYLCRLVAEAHGGRFTVRNAHPGLAVTATLPGA